MYADRRSAGRDVADLLKGFSGQPAVLVLALPRGGVPVAYEVARSLDVPLDILVVRKVGVPGHEELALGAVASGGIRVMNADVVHAARIPSALVEDLFEEALRQVVRQEAELRGQHPAADLRDSTVIIVDDGLATGATMEAAVKAVKTMARSTVVAVPVGSTAACDQLRRVADLVVCAAEPRGFFAVGQFYRDFTQTTDDEVRKLLDLASERPRVA